MRIARLNTRTILTPSKNQPQRRPLIHLGLLALVLALAGCDGADPVSVPVGLSPTPIAPQATVPPPVSPGQSWLEGYTLTAASLSGVVHESTPTGNVPIPGALVYCELCGEGTHTWATADADGFYRFPGDPAKGGGVWLAPGRVTPIIVQGAGLDERTWLARNLSVLIAGDTRLDIALVRR